MRVNARETHLPPLSWPRALYAGAKVLVSIQTSKTGFWTRDAQVTPGGFFKSVWKLPREKTMLLHIFLKFSVFFLPSKRIAAASAKSLQSCPTLCDSIDSSPPGSPVPGIPQARTLEWVAISFSNAWKWKVKVKSLSPVRLFPTPWNWAALKGRKQWRVKLHNIWRYSITHKYIDQQNYEYWGSEIITS